jgi:hypothetical protein
LGGWGFDFDLATILSGVERAGCGLGTVVHGSGRRRELAESWMCSKNFDAKARRRKEKQKKE